MPNNKLKKLTQTSATIIIMDQENEIFSANNIEESFRTTPEEEEEETKLTSDHQLNNDDSSETPSIHGFLNITVNNTIIERPSSSEEMLKNTQIISTKKHCCEGSDSGVEVVDSSDYHLRALSSNSTVSQEGENISVRSRDSSISYCSNYEDAYNILVRRNSTLLEDYTLRNNHNNNNGDVTSENGSESSSLSGSQTRCRRSAIITVKKKSTTITTPPDRNKKEISKEKFSNSKTNKPPITPCRNASSANLRLKSVDRLQANKTAVNNSPRTNNNSVFRTKQVPNSLDLAKNPKKPTTTTRPNLPCSLTCSLTKSCIDNNKNPSFNNKSKQLSQIENKTIEKYATLPRRRKEKLDDKKNPLTPPTTTIIMKKSSNKETPPSRMMFSSLYLPKAKIRTKIFHETNTQTALTLSDMENALAGKLITSKDPEETEKCTKSIQVDMRAKDVEKLKEQLKKLTEKYDVLANEHKMQNEKLQNVESELKQEKLESKSLKKELKTNSNRILAILGRAKEEESQEEIDGTSSSPSSSGDSLLVLESRFQNVSKVIIQQEEEIAKLNNYVRLYEINLGKSQEAEKMLQQKHQDLETESQELQEFLQAEKSTICDALKEAETEIKNYQLVINQKDEELKVQREESKQFSRLCEQRRLENLGFQARIANFEAKSRELLVQQGSSVSGASVALASLIERLSGLADELIAAYNISEQELEDVIYHNEVYKNSSSSIESTPEKSNKIFTDDQHHQLLTPNGKSGSSFVSAVINAIKNAAVGRETTSDRKNSLFDRSTSNELLDSETEPCLMMEHVLEDVVIPDGHSHNMISSGHGSMSLSSRLTQSESMKEVSNLYFSRQPHSEPTSLNTSYNSDIFSISEFMPPISLVDQVIDVDNVITRLLKVIRIIQIENEDCMSELQDQRDNLTEQVDQQKETNKLIVKQLKDWEVLGARLKSEVKELMNQLSKKTSEIDSIKTELNKQREEIEKLNQDVCDLSTALAKAELEIRVKEDEAENALNKYQQNEEIPSAEILAKIIITYKNEVPELKSKLAEKEKYLNELNEEFQIGKKILGESLKQAVNEAKRQYDAIDHALEVLNSLQSVVQQCPILAKLQRDLEEISFQSASTLPIITPADFNANAGLGPVVANLEIAPTINTTA